MLLLIPAVSMLITDEVNWGLSDFLVAAVLFGSAALAVDCVLRFAKSPLVKFALAGIVLVVLAIIWAELAVGVFSSPIAGN